MATLQHHQPERVDDDAVVVVPEKRLRQAEA